MARTLLMLLDLVKDKVQEVKRRMMLSGAALVQ